MRSPPLKPILKKAKHGFKGYPVATVMLYGPDDKAATGEPERPARRRELSNQGAGGAL